MRWIALIYSAHHPGADGVHTLCKSISPQVYRHSDQYPSWSTPQACELRHQGLVLEVQSSERLFGGANRLLTRLWKSLDGLQVQGVGEPSMLAPTAPSNRGIFVHQAPSALGAWALCKSHPAANLDEFLYWGQQPQDTQLERLQGLPISALDLSPHQRQMMLQFGFKTLRDLLQQSREQLAQRLGPQLLQQLDGLQGKHPWMGTPLADPDTFCAHQELPFHCHDQHRIEKLAEKLLQDLEVWLKARKLKTWALHFRFFQAHQVIPLSIHSAQGLQHSAEGLLLLHHQLANMQFTDDVRSIELQSGQLAPATDTNTTLFPDSHQSSQKWLEVCDLLSARLGAESIQYVQPIEDPRADHGFELKAQAANKLPLPPKPQGFVPQERQHARLSELAVRPLWLLPEPLRLHGPEPSWTEQSRSEWWLLSGPERIDFGWWEQTSAQRRDYYRAMHRNRSQAWLFCEEERQKKGGAPDTVFRSWYIHGYFA